MRGPLDVIAEGWQYKEQEEVRICEWVEQLGKQLEALRDIMRKKESEVKGKMKADYDRKAKVREFNVGSMVMIRIPGMNGKLEDSWDGPYVCMCVWCECVCVCLCVCTYRISSNSLRGINFFQVLTDCGY